MQTTNEAVGMSVEDQLWTKRLMIEELTWRLPTEKELDAVIRFCIDQFFTAPVDLKNATARAIWIEAHQEAWSKRLEVSRRLPTPEDVEQMYGELIRSLGDDPSYGLPMRRTRRTRPRKLNGHGGAVIPFVKPDDDDGPKE